MRHLALSFAAFILGLAAIPATAGNACAPSCEVPSHTLAFAPPVTVVSSGATVTWTAIDTVHTSTDRDTWCFHTDYTVFTPGRATFVVDGGRLFAASDGGELEECALVAPLPDGSFALEYTCLYHPNMRAMLVIR